MDSHWIHLKILLYSLLALIIILQHCILIWTNIHVCTIFMSQDHSTDTLSHFLLSFSAVWFQCTQWMPLCHILPPVQTDICLWVWEWSCPCIQCPDNQHAGWTQVCQILSLKLKKTHSFQQMYINMYMNHHFNGVTFEVNELNFLTKKITLVWNTYEVHIPTGTL